MRRFLLWAKARTYMLSEHVLIYKAHWLSIVRGKSRRVAFSMGSYGSNTLKMTVCLDDSRKFSFPKDHKFFFLGWG